MVRVAGDMNLMRLSFIWSSYALLGLMPGADAQAALQAAVVAQLAQAMHPQHVAAIMDPQHVAEIVRSYETLGLIPRVDA